METHTYPGRGLSLPQLVFALNEELKHVAYSPCFALDTVSQLDRDTSTALAAIREWKNSFTPINRIPLDVLSLIPTHLSSQKDRFLTTFVCRHWRRTFLQHGALWSQVFFKKGEAYTKTLLERANGSALNVFIGKDVPITSMALLSPQIRQIKHLEFNFTYWEDIRKFSEVDSGPLPLLRTLKITPGPRAEDNDPSVMMSPPSPPLFSNAINLEEFTFDSFGFQFLNHFIFPHLTTFRLRTLEVTGSGVSELFDFLKASPTLQTVDINTIESIVLADIPQQVLVVLPNVEAFSLAFGSKDVYDVAAHISCPRAKNTSLMYSVSDVDVSPRQEIFPTSVSLNTIIHQYTRSPVEEVTLKIIPTSDTCSLTFRSADTSTIRLVLQVLVVGDDEDELEVNFDDIACEAFCQGLGTIRVHPQLSHVKRLRIGYPTILNLYQVIRMVTELGVLFGSMGPLDKLTIEDSDLYPYLYGFGNLPTPGKQTVFPPIKELILLRPEMDAAETYVSAIVELGKSQHARGMPFERVTIRSRTLLSVMVEGLRQWVGTVDCCEEDSVTESY